MTLNALYTPVATTPTSLRITHEQPILLLGSCFADEMGSRLAAAGFEVLCNPFGTLYNPLSIAACLSRALHNELLDESYLLFRDGLWHSWLHHTRFSHPDRDTALRQCNDAITLTHSFLSRNPLLFITFGTAYVFRLAAPHPLAGTVVANCHKMPANTFIRSRLTVEEIVQAWQSLMDEADRLMPAAATWLFTVSPIRHLADGAHAGQLSKASLLLAVDELLSQNGNRPIRHAATDPLMTPSTAWYFDSYEILLDELRDYRFYARDLCHPSDLAADIIFERLQLALMPSETQRRCQQHLQEHRRQQHRQLVNND